MPLQLAVPLSPGLPASLPKDFLQSFSLPWHTPPLNTSQVPPASVVKIRVFSGFHSHWEMWAASLSLSSYMNHCLPQPHLEFPKSLLNIRKKLTPKRLLTVLPFAREAPSTVAQPLPSMSVPPSEAVLVRATVTSHWVC